MFLSLSHAFAVTITIPTDQIDPVDGTEVSFIYAINGDCTTSTTYLIPADVSTQTGSVLGLMNPQRGT